MNRLILLSSLIFLIVCGSCRNSQSKNTNSEDKTIMVTDTDKEMNDAIIKAKSTFSQFVVAIKSNDSTLNGFAIKMRFAASNGVSYEHIWLNNIKTRNGIYFGIVDNDPENVTYLKLGDTVQIDTSKVSDWLYLKKDTLIGGYTIKVLRNRMSDSEKQELDEKFHVKDN